VEEPKEDVKKKLRMRVAAIRELRYSEAHYYTQLKTIIYDVRKMQKLLLFLELSRFAQIQSMIILQLLMIDGK
jgi:hypothetical protein